MTRCTAVRIQRNHSIKAMHNHKYDKGDIIFDQSGPILKISFCCFIAAQLAAIAGIAGGCIYQGFFLTFFNMIPTVMVATQQLITMFSCWFLTLQFIYLGQISGSITLIYVLIALCTSQLAICWVTKEVKRTGR